MRGIILTRIKKTVRIESMTSSLGEEGGEFQK